MYQPSAYHTLYRCPPTFNWQATEPHSTVMWLKQLMLQWASRGLFVHNFKVKTEEDGCSFVSIDVHAAYERDFEFNKLRYSKMWAELWITSDLGSAKLIYKLRELQSMLHQKPCHHQLIIDVLQSSPKSQRWMFAVIGVHLCRFPNPDDYSDVLKQVQPSLHDLILSFTWYDPDEWPTIAKVHTIDFSINFCVGNY